MSKDCGHEHFKERVTLTLTPGGLQLNVLGLVGELFNLLQAKDYEAVTELVDVVGQMLTAAYTGHTEPLEQGYKEAVAIRFKEQLDDPEALRLLAEEDK